ncbi:hypothetical protein AB0D30_20635 [Streptomyces sp. NPDC048409]|uniref:hypothetical protein n=1 Tax=unclassified Streptomyces TaxID=2593676 RepID=UPI00342D2079
MAGAVFMGVSGLVFLLAGAWTVRRGRRGRADTRAGWAGVALGWSQLLHAAGTLPGVGQPLELVLASSCGVCGVAGAVLLAAAGRSLRASRRGGGRPKPPSPRP